MIVILAFRLSSFDKNGLPDDPTFRESQFITWTSTELHYSLMAATIPILRPFMSNLSTNYGAGQGPESSGYGQGSMNSRAHSVSRRQENHATTQGFEMRSMTGRSTRPEQRSDSRVDKLQRDTRMSSPLGQSSDTTRDVDAGSTGSGGSQKMIIRKDITWQVDRDDDQM